MNAEVNYKNKQRYKGTKLPARQGKFWIWLIWLLTRCALIGRKFKVERINMEGLKAPYLILSNHMHFVDFEIAGVATYPSAINNVVGFDGFVYGNILLKWIGAIPTRRFTNDLTLVKTINRVLKRGDIVTMYPEARYSPCGITSYIPESVGKLVKMNKVPVVAAVHHGNHLHSPFWNFRKKRKVPMHTTYTLILTPEQIAQMSVRQINAAIYEALEYDDYRYQKEQGIRITEPYRAEGLHKVLYQCPHCKEEFKMDSSGAELFCTACGKRWYWREDGYLEACDGETEFDHIPDWFNWEREQVKQQLSDGTYAFEDEVQVYSLPRAYPYIPLGKAKLTHDPQNGFTLHGHYRGKDYHIRRTPSQTSGVHVEYDFRLLSKRDYVDISTESDSFCCIPSKKNVITKISFAVEELYLRNKKKVRAK